FHSVTDRLYTLSLLDALPISLARGGHRGDAEASDGVVVARGVGADVAGPGRSQHRGGDGVMHRALRSGSEREELLRGELIQRLQDRKSTRLNSSHVKISYAVF